MREPYVPVYVFVRGIEKATVSVGFVYGEGPDEEG